MTAIMKKLFSTTGLLILALSLTVVMATTGPAIASSGITLSLSDNTVVTTTTTVLSGTVSSDFSTNLTVNGISVAISPQGAWSKTLNLTAGSNTIEVKATGTSGTTSQTIHIIAVAVTPYITLYDPSSITVISSSRVVTALVYGDNYDVLVNGDSVAFTQIPIPGSNGEENLTVTASSLNPGNNVVTFIAIKNGQTVTKSIILIYDDTPNVTIDTPSNGATIDSSMLPVRVTGITNVMQLECFLKGISQGTPTISGSDYSFDLPQLQPGTNIIEVRATNGNNDTKVTSKSITVEYQTGNPVVYGLNQPADGAVSYNGNLTISGKIRNADKLDIEVVAGPHLWSGTFATAGGEYVFSTNVTLPNNLPLRIRLTPSKNGTSGQAVDLTNVIWHKEPKLVLELPLPVASPPSDDYLTVVYPTVTSTENRVHLTGRAENATKVLLKVPGKADVYLGTSTFDYWVDLGTGTNNLVVQATSSYGLTVNKTVNVSYGSGPMLNIVSPTMSSNSLTVTQSLVRIIGNAARIKAGGLTLTLTASDGVITTYNPTVDAQGNFNQIMYLKSGVNTVKLEATDGSATSTRTITFNYDTTPLITVKSPLPSDVINTNSVTFTGTVWNTDAHGLYINGDMVTFSTNGDFSYLLNITGQTSRTVTIRASNGERTVSQQVYLNYSASPEVLFTSHSDQDTVYSNTVTIKGRLLGAVGPYSAITLKVNNLATTVDDNGYFSQKVTLKKGTNTITVNGTVYSGSVTKSIKLTYNDLPLEGAHLEITPKSTATNLKLFGDAVGLAIPASAFNGSQTLDITIESSDEVDKDSSDIIYASKIYEIDCHDPESPIALSLKYIEGLRDTLTNKLAIYWYDGGEWVSLGGKVDAKKRTVTAQITGGGTYAVMASVASFRDMSGHWAQDDVEILTAKGVLTGRGGRYFGPEASVTRAEFVKMLVKALNIPIYDEPDPAFYDVDSGDWEYDYVQAALRVGIIKGTGGRYFRPGQYVTRVEAAIMLARAANLKQATASEISTAFKAFRDQNSILYGQKEVAAAVKAGFIKGTSPNTFSPSQYTTRAQSAKLLVRLMITQKKM